jgi:hypothetical protein
LTSSASLGLEVYAIFAWINVNGDGVTCQEFLAARQDDPERGLRCMARRLVRFV